MQHLQTVGGGEIHQELEHWWIDGFQPFAHGYAAHFADEQRTHPFVVAEAVFFAKRGEQAAQPLGPIAGAEGFAVGGGAGVNISNASPTDC